LLRFIRAATGGFFIAGNASFAIRPVADLDILCNILGGVNWGRILLFQVVGLFADVYDLPDSNVPSKTVVKHHQGDYGAKFLAHGLFCISSSAYQRSSRVNSSLLQLVQKSPVTSSTQQLTKL
jgi:hypothetical protein